MGIQVFPAAAKIEYAVWAKLKQLIKERKAQVLELAKFDAATFDDAPIRLREFEFTPGAADRRWSQRAHGGQGAEAPCQLWIIKAAFRVQKHDLAMRPIYHWKPKRIEAHILIRYLAYALLRHAQYRVNLQQEPVSVEQLRNELLAVQASILVDQTTRARYRLPSPMTQRAKATYQTFNLKRTQAPTPLIPDPKPAGKKV